MRIIVATNNKGKAKEFKEVLADISAEVLTLKDIGMVSDPEENGETFAENARIKAMDVHEKLKAAGEEKDTIVMADDSGLCIDFLGGEPGVKSARFMGHSTPYNEKNRAILDLLKDAGDGDRGASFVCHVCTVLPDGRVIDAESEMRGSIAEEAKGGEGFGYDPIFYVPEYGKTGGELTPEEKNAVSHRGKVLRKVRELLCREMNL